MIISFFLLSSVLITMLFVYARYVGALNKYGTNKQTVTYKGRVINSCSVKEHSLVAAIHTVDIHFETVFLLTY